MKTKTLSLSTLWTLVALVAAPCFAKDTTSELLSIAKQRQLGADDLLAAAKTWTPSGRQDQFLCINSGGQAGSAILYGVPSMRIYKYVPTSAHDAANGFLYDQQTKQMLKQARIAPDQEYTWADTHHPAFSETDGTYDGRYAFLNDKANPRIFVIDLKDFQTKQVVINPIYMSSHGGAFVTPNNEYVMEAAQYPSPMGGSYVPLDQESFNKNYRGGITFHKFDNVRGRIDTGKSFSIEAPPYTQDLSDAGKGESYGFTFTNSFCSERYIGSGPKGENPPFEAGCSANDTDYMHVVNWKKAEQLFLEGKFRKVNGHAVIPLEVAAKEGVLFLIPEPKSPHGADVSPDGRFIIVAGKLDTHGSVYDFRKIKDLIDKKDFAEFDDYGVPILDLQKSLHAQVQLGLGPLHTQFGKEPGIVYTSLYLDSQVVKWDYLNKRVLDKVSINYNIGHLVSMQGDAQDPAGKFVVALNKLAIDRFDPVGPLLPQNHQLIDTSGEKMKVIYDLPLPMGEPHYTVCIDSKKLNPIQTYPAGTDPVEMKPSPVATSKGKERIVRSGNKVEIFATVTGQSMAPAQAEVKQGDEVIYHITNIETQVGKVIQFTVDGMGVLGIYPPGKTSSLRFVASQAGEYNTSILDISSPFSSEAGGTLKVKPNQAFEARRVAANKLKQQYLATLFKVPKIKVEKLKVEHPGLAKFQSYGCAGCHRMGKSGSAPDLATVTERRSKEWIKGFIANPSNYFQEPEVQEMIKKYGLEMPNLNVKPEDIDQIVDYLEKFKSSKQANVE